MLKLQKLIFALNFDIQKSLLGKKGYIKIDNSNIEKEFVKVS